MPNPQANDEETPHAGNIEISRGAALIFSPVNPRRADIEGSKSAIRGFKGVSISTAPLEISMVPTNIQKKPIPGATILTDEKKRIKSNQQRFYFAIIGATIVILLILIIISLEGLKTEEELIYASYPKRLEAFGFREYQLRATVKQLFIDGTLNLTMLMSNESSLGNPVLSNVLEASLERCSSHWSEVELNGRCFGLLPHSSYLEMKAIQIVPSPTFCKALCCELGPRCSSWQYLIKNYPPPKLSDRVCFLGGPVNYEQQQGKSTTNWCEKQAPPKWRGRHIKSRVINNDTDSKSRIRSTFGKEYNCDWGEELSTYCSGLGSERTLTFYRNKTDRVGNIERLSRKQCAASCCATIGCTHWQELPDRGCFHNDKYSKEKVICESYQSIYSGGTKKRNIQI